MIELDGIVHSDKNVVILQTKANKQMKLWGRKTNQI